LTSLVSKESPHFPLLQFDQLQPCLPRFPGPFPFLSFKFHSEGTTPSLLLLFSLIFLLFFSFFLLEFNQWRVENFFPLYPSKDQLLVPPPSPAAHPPPPTHTHTHTHTLLVSMMSRAPPRRENSWDDFSSSPPQQPGFPPQADLEDKKPGSATGAGAAMMPTAQLMMGSSPAVTSAVTSNPETKGLTAKPKFLKDSTFVEAFTSNVTSTMNGWLSYLPTSVSKRYWAASSTSGLFLLEKKPFSHCPN